MEGNTVLIIEDDPITQNLLKTIYSRAGADVLLSTDGDTGLRMFSEHKPDIVILDLMLPNINGWTVCRQIRQISDTPIIILTALSSETGMIEEFDSVAIEYITKPFSSEDLLARTRAVLDKLNSPATSNPIIYDDGHLQFNPLERKLLVDNKPVRLTKTENRLLEVLVRQKDRLLTYDQLLQHVWGWDHIGKPEKVQLNISRLRQKIEKNPQQPAYLILEAGLGYWFQSANADDNA